MVDSQKFEAARLAIRSRNPLVHCITNYVAMEFNADALLAVGASPFMSFCQEEIPDIAREADVLVVNLGCLDNCQIDAMKKAADCMNALGKPWVLDPVGAGSTEFRTRTAHMLIREYHPTVIRGNASEIMSLAGDGSLPRGVDARNDSMEAVRAADKLAAESGSVVSASGEVDIICDGSNIEYIFGGNAIMSRVTAMGCTATAITAAFLPVCDTPYEAAMFAMTLMARCGEKAAGMCQGPSSMRCRFIDALYKTGK